MLSSTAFFAAERRMIEMAKKKTIPQYGSVMRKGIPYYRTRIMDADGNYGHLCKD